MLVRKCIIPSSLICFLNVMFYSNAHAAIPNEEPVFELMSKKLRTNVDFIEHSGAGFGSYLARNLPFEPIQDLKNQLTKYLGHELIDRGEAHITVIAPNEFQKLSKKISIDEINNIARTTIQSAPLEFICLGRGEKTIWAKSETTYFVVVKSNKLLQLRREIARKFIEAGGSASDFNADIYNPHITVGYSKRDLHYEEGVIKDKSSCIARFKPSPKEATNTRKRERQ